MHTIAHLFTPEPKQWGLRGDPHLWRELQQYFEGKELPFTDVELNDQLIAAFMHFTGEQLQLERNVFVKRYPPLGMSGGMVCGRFWVQNGLPLLLERYHNCQ